MAENTTYQYFKSKYIATTPGWFRWQTTPLQVYPLEMVSQYLVVPTPLLTADYHYLVFLDEGSYQQQIGIEKYMVDAPSVMYVAEGEASALQSIAGKIAGYFILMDKRVFSAIVNKIDITELSSIESIIYLKKEDRLWFKKLCELLYEEVSSQRPNRGVGNGLLQAMIHKLISLTEGKKSTHARTYYIANHFKQLLEKHLKEHKTAAYYANELNVSENYLNRCVKSTYNKNCKQIIRETAILQSQILMFETQKDIGEISFIMGFEDPSYFSRVFKRVAGQTPTDFRKQIMHGLS